MSNKYHYIVYIHINKTNGKVYVGITGMLAKKRWSRGGGYKSNKHFYRAIEKYGWDGFLHIVFRSQLSKEEACSIEQQLITSYKADDYKHGYNKSKGGECNNYQGKNSSTPEYQREAGRKCYEKHREERKAHLLKYRIENPEKVREQQKAYKKAHKEEMKAHYRKYYETHREERIAYAKARHELKKSMKNKTI